MLSAIADAKSAVKENASFHTLALMYYDQGDLSRAFKYTQAAGVSEESFLGLCRDFYREGGGEK